MVGDATPAPSLISKKTVAVGCQIGLQLTVKLILVFNPIESSHEGAVCVCVWWGEASYKERILPRSLHSSHTKGQFLEAGTRETSHYQILLFLIEYLSFNF